MIIVPVQTVTNDFNGLATLANAILPNGSKTIKWTVTDVGGNTANCSITVNVGTSLTTTHNNSNRIIYFGYSGDQSSTYTVVPSGGTAPYKVTFTMNRTLKCNQITDAGDEIWTATGTNTTTGVTCHAYPDSLFSPNPQSIITAGPYSVTVTLMADAILTATIEDKNGCTITDTTLVQAEDVRCFAGKSGNAKITLCHKTGSAKEPLCNNLC
jgi:hypothetical protein